MKKNTILLFFLFMASFCIAQEEKVLFSSDGGFYENSFQLSLYCFYANHHIRYTTDGNTPTAQSTLYDAPLLLNEQLYSDADIYTIQISPEDLIYIPDSVRHAIVIRAAVFDENDSCISQTTTNTYLIHSLGMDNHNMAVVSICADSLLLFDYETGIFVPGIHFDPDSPDHSGNYYQKGRAWERQVNVEFYESSDNSGINQICGLRTHGNRSRRYPSKGMKIYAREEYGKKRFEHDFFGDTCISSFKHLVLKPFASFWPFSGIQDYFCNITAVRLGLDAPLCRPVLVYLNGEYWGVYFIQEKTDERFLEDHHDIDLNNCNIISSWKGEVDYGNNVSFRQMMNWFDQANLTNNNTYEQAGSLIDIPNFIDYYVFETFVGNWDWPGNNMRCWQESDGLWRWIFFDGDATLMGDIDVFNNAAVYTPPSTWLEYPEAKLLFGKLLKNTQFRNAFQERAQELCSGLFLYENTYPLFHDMLETLHPTINDQKHRFGYPPSEAYWINGNDVINEFLEHRVENYLSAMTQFMNLLDIEEPRHEEPLCCFPNPTEGTLWVQIPSDCASATEMYVYDITGAIVQREPIHELSKERPSPIRLNLKSGLYLVRIENHIQRIIVQ